jgi:hypothetical protein
MAPVAAQIRVRRGNGRLVADLRLAPAGLTELVPRLGYGCATLAAARTLIVLLEPT